ncbi:MAG: PilZ domain-containing protein [Candidatus Omnitrophica bacterium]|nr:PilZ domain-containing protein [Candidatus Omnitrophota bacterium]MDD5654177.1 PilZ domain-containing protein [Candidatus Omnitrophota bacterium]
MDYSGPERRKYPRIGGKFLVSYRIADKDDLIDITQTKNVSLGGILLTTDRAFKPGTDLMIEVRLPIDPKAIKIVARVRQSKELIKGMIYDTHLEFMSIDEHHKNMVAKTIEHILKKV